MKKRKVTDVSERIIDGIRYHIQKSITSKTGLKRRYLSCSTPNCCGTAVQSFKDGDWVSEIKKEHAMFCLPSSSLLQKVRFEEAIKDALSQNFYGLKQLYDSLAPVYPEASEKLSFNDLKAKMKMWRRQMYPKNPESIEEFIEQINNTNNSRIFQGVNSKLTCQIIKDNNEKVHIVLYDRTLLANDFKHVNRIFIDGTFKTTPNIEEDTYKQLFTIMGVSHGHAFPMVFCLMTAKSKDAYNSVFEFVIKEHLVDSHNIKVVMSDFEFGLRNSAIHYFPRARCVGCNVHYDRAIYRRLSNLKLAPFIRDNAVAQEFVQNILLLAFIPADCIIPEFNRLLKKLDSKCKRKLQPFLKYFNNFWIKKVKPHGFSIFGLLVRTNNVEEAYHARLLSKFGAHPLPWDFIPWTDLIEKSINCEELLNILRRYKGKISQRLLRAEREFGECTEEENTRCDVTGEEVENDNDNNEGAVHDNLNMDDPDYDENLRDAIMRMNTLDNTNASSVDDVGDHETSQSQIVNNSPSNNEPLDVSGNIQFNIDNCAQSIAVDNRHSHHDEPIDNVMSNIHVSIDNCAQNVAVSNRHSCNDEPVDNVRSNVHISINNCAESDAVDNQHSYNDENAHKNQSTRNSNNIGSMAEKNDDSNYDINSKSNSGINGHDNYVHEELNLSPFDLSRHILEVENEKKNTCMRECISKPHLNTQQNEVLVRRQTFCDITNSAVNCTEKISVTDEQVPTCSSSPVMSFRINKYLDVVMASDSDGDVEPVQRHGIVIAESDENDMFNTSDSPEEIPNSLPVAQNTSGMNNSTGKKKKKKKKKRPNVIKRRKLRMLREEQKQLSKKSVSDTVNNMSNMNLQN